MSRQQAKYTANSIDVIYDDMEKISAGYTLKGSVADFASLPSNPAQGDGWVTSDTGHLWVWDGTQWNDAGQFSGPAGPPGPPGDPADASYTHTQVTASDTWVITHNLGFYPNVTVVDTADSVIVPALQYNDVNTVTALFSGATSGKAYCS